MHIFSMYSTIIDKVDNICVYVSVYTCVFSCETENVCKSTSLSVFLCVFACVWTVIDVSVRSHCAPSFKPPSLSFPSLRLSQAPSYTHTLRTCVIHTHLLVLLINHTPRAHKQLHTVVKFHADKLIPKSTYTQTTLIHRTNPFFLFLFYRHPSLFNCRWAGVEV